MNTTSPYDAFPAGRSLQEILRRPRVSVSSEHYFAGIETVFDHQENLSFTQDTATVPKAMTEQSRKMGMKIYRAGKRVYSAVGYGLGNVIFVVGDSGLVVIDTTERVEAAALARDDFFKALPEAKNLPIVAVIYTHNHTDHIGGVRTFASEDSLAKGCQIIAHDTLMQAVVNNAVLVAPILGLRSAYSFGAFLEVGEKGQVNSGLGPKFAEGQTSFLPPTLTFKDQLSITLAGVRFELRHAPSECDDEIIAWLPDEQILISAEVVQGECLCNLHTLRGTKYRDPLQWVKTLDFMREYPAAFMVASHGRPVAGAANVAELLEVYRDAIAFIHDQSVRFINQGAKPDELADLLPALPPHLAQHAWLGEYYGTVKHSVRQIFTGQLGWFDGDPATLDPLPPHDRAARWLALLGGRSVLLPRIEAALVEAQKGALDEARWAAELASVLVRADSSDEAAKHLKAQAFQILGFATENINWRNWYLTASRELQGTLQMPPLGRALIAPDILNAIPPLELLGMLSVRVAAERCFDKHLWMRFELTDTHQIFELELRKGVLQINELLAHIPQVENTQNIFKKMPILSLNRSILPQLLVGGIAAFPKLLEAGKIEVKGDFSALAEFFSYFDKRPTELPKLASR